MSDIPKKIEYRCPKCQRLLYDRRRKKCMWCNHELPAELLFTPEEMEKLEKEAAEIEAARHHLKLKQDEEEAKKKKKGGDDFPPIIFS
jgi:hypothetical protein